MFFGTTALWTAVAAVACLAIGVFLHNPLDKSWRNQQASERVKDASTRFMIAATIFAMVAIVSFGIYVIVSPIPK
jgi:small-conductance mechanosensitive channel